MSLGSFEGPASLQRKMLDEWHASCLDMGIDDKISVSDRWLNSMLGLQSIDGLSEIEFIRNPTTGDADKTVIDSRALHRLQFLAIQGLLRTFPNEIRPQDVLKSLMEASEPVTSSDSSTFKFAAEYPKPTPAANQTLASVIVAGVQLSVSRVPFLIGSNASACHFTVSAAICPDHSNIAGIHCIFDRKDGVWFLDNVTETGVVVVDGCEVSGKTGTEIKSGSVVTIGHGAMSFTFFPSF